MSRTKLLSLSNLVPLSLVIFVVIWTQSYSPGVSGAITSKVVVNSDGVVQFSLSKDSILLPNLQRDPYGTLALKFTLTGATIEQVIEKNRNAVWNLVLKDGSTVTVSSKTTDGIQEYYAVWATAEQGKEVCFSLGNDSVW